MFLPAMDTADLCSVVPPSENISPGDHAPWLGNGNDVFDALRSLLVPYPAELMKGETVE